MSGAPKDIELRRRIVEAYNNRGERSAAEICQQFGIGRTALFRYVKEVSEPRAESPAALVTRVQGERDSAELTLLRAERDQLKAHAEALRKTVVLLGGKS